MIPIPACRVVVAPGDGRLTDRLDDGVAVRRGDVVGTLVGASGTTRLLAPEAGRLGGALVGPRQTVAAGEALLWLARA